MNYIEINPEELVNMLESMIDSVVYKRRFTKTKKKSFAKVAFNVTKIEDLYFVTQLTICSSDCFTLKPLMIRALMDVIIQKKIFKIGRDIVVIGTVHEKRSKTAIASKHKSVFKIPTKYIQTQQIMCRRNKSLSLQTYSGSEPFEEPAEFLATKRYISIKLFFKVPNDSLDSFTSLIMCYILHTEQIDPNMKFVFKNDSQYIHWNKVPMDDMVLSCNILTSSLSNIFNHSKDEDFRLDVMDLLGIDKPSVFKQTVGCMLLQQINQNYDPSFMENLKNELDISKQNTEIDGGFEDDNNVTNEISTENEIIICNEDSNSTLSYINNSKEVEECNVVSNGESATSGSNAFDKNLMEDSNSRMSYTENSSDIFACSDNSNMALENSKDAYETIVGL